MTFAWAPGALLGVAWVGSATAGIYCGLVVVAAERFRRRRARDRVPSDLRPPPLSILKPLHGAEPGLHENLRGFFQQRYAGEYELLFCARQQDDAGLAVASALIRQFPAVPARVLTCGEPQFPNPKTWSLAVMAKAAKHHLLVTSDADARVGPHHLQHLARELRSDSVDCAFCLYLAEVDPVRVVPHLHGPLTVDVAPGLNVALHLDALGKSVEMNSGVLVAEMLSGVDFTLGVTVIQRREVFDAVGGFAFLGGYWAEDFVLGSRLAAMGRGVRISTEVIGLVVWAESAAQSFLNQLRWAQSTRRSRPLGHLGTGLTFAMPFGLLGFVAEAVHSRWLPALGFIAVAMLNRVAQSAFVLRALGSPRVAALALLYPVRDLLGFLLWLCSYLPAETRYHGTHFRIMPDGRLQQD